MATYSFQDITASLIGPGLDADLGYGAGVAEEGISIVYDEDKNKKVIGSDGEGINVLNASKSGVITVRLLKTSPMNAVLQAAFDAQSLSPSLWGLNVFTMRNARTGDTHAARDVAFKKNADKNESKDPKMMEWPLDALKIDSVLGTF